MRLPRCSALLILLLVLLLVPQLVHAQEQQFIVPDVTGLTPPQASAALNRAGFFMGALTNVQWTEASGQAINTVVSQSIAPGASATRGTSVNLTVLRNANAVLIYDDNDITLANLSGQTLNLRPLVFTTVEGGPSFEARDWRGTLDPGQCVQLWSVPQTQPKGHTECAGFQRWLAIGNRAAHFWTGAGGTTFQVRYNDRQSTTCEIGAGRCNLFLPIGSFDPNTDYLYFAYTADRLAVINPSDAAWMPLEQLKIRNNAAGGNIVEVGNRDLYGNLDVMGHVRRLGPKQCIVFTASADTTPPEACEVIVALPVDPATAFWAAAFDYDSQTGGQRYDCPAAKPTGMTICVMPR